jgi:hypothetical protein
LNVLRTINFNLVRFDVISVEVDPKFRPPGYAEMVTGFLQSKNYKNVTDVVGRNKCKSVLNKDMKQRI